MLHDVSFADDIRQLAATCISENPHVYNEAFLDRSNAEYCQWILNKDHWGGNYRTTTPFITFPSHSDIVSLYSTLRKIP